jgi:hypothetical protein
MVTAELAILLFISMWLKSRDKGSDSSSEESMSPTLDQMGVVENEIEAEG